MKNKDNFTDSEYNPFDAPIPGQSLTDEPGNYPWEHPPQYSDPEEVIDNLYDKLTTGEMAEQVIAMLDAGVPVEAIVRVMTFSGFMQGKFTPDVGFMIVEPLMKLVSAIGIRAGVKELKLSLEDLSNNKFLKDMAELKAANKELQSISQDIQQDLPEPEEQGPGLMAKKPMEEMEQSEEMVNPQLEGAM
jgi:hypothetical protein|tara:strand:+ start:270 stop:836 length:567 start_codon:yes stop_codon:yes gene_type:complete